MSALFLDTNVVIKLYVAEAWSDWARHLVTRPEYQGRIFISEMVVLEVNSALGKMVRTRRISRLEMRSILKEFYVDGRDSFHVQRWRREIFEGAVIRLGLHPELSAGAMDMVHLETVQFLGRNLPHLPSISIASADVALLKAADSFRMDYECPPELRTKVVEARRGSDR